MIDIYYDVKRSGMSPDSVSQTKISLVLPRLLEWCV
jgi:hypothetical protein